ncbi:MAG: cytochrome C [Thermodesulfobacteriota bacterium]
MTRPARAAVALALGAALLATPPLARAYSPEVNYALHCQGCHLADGRATPGLVPPLDGTLGRMMRLRAGRAYVVRLPNVAATHLDDADTAALVTWVVRRFAGGELPEDFVPFTPQEVAAGRRAPLVDVEGARRALLEQLDGQALE